VKVLVDFSQTVISSVVVHSKDLKSGDDAKDLIKHIILNQLLGLKKRFGGELVICCDSKTYWRKEIFEHYKGHRKHTKNKGKDILDWALLYKTMDEIKVELRDNFPYKILEVNRAEADDIFGTLVNYYQTNELITNGLIEEPNTVVLVSTDCDFIQLLKYKNVKVWNNVKKSFISTKNPTHALIEHICTGDTGDNLPNIVTPDSWAADRSNNISTRANPFPSSRLSDFFEKGYSACKNETEQRNWKRNEVLIDLSKIPKEINDAIIEQYINHEVQGSKKRIFDYLQSKRMKLLLSSATDF